MHPTQRYAPPTSFVADAAHAWSGA